MVNPALGTHAPEEFRAHRGTGAAKRLERREYQAWLSTNPLARSERRTIDALVISGRHRSNGQVMASCLCGWTGYTVGHRCPRCWREV